MFKANQLDDTVGISKEAILDRVAEEDIFRKYFVYEPVIGGGRMYTNPYRNDPNPGCCFYKNSSGRLLFHDYSRGESYDCFTVVMKNKSCTFWEALKTINEDFNLQLGTKYARAKIQKEEREVNSIKKTTSPLLQAEVRDFTEADLTYWKKGSIKKSTLEKFNTYAASSIFLNKRLIARSTDTNPIFVYLAESGKLKWYRPLERNKRKKWGNNMTRKDICGYAQLPFSGDKLVITKSRKDVMSLYELGYSAISPLSETTTIPKAILDELSIMFDNIYILFDNDEAGIHSANRLAKKYPNFKVVFYEDAKDTFDMVDLLGKRKVKQILETLLD